MLTPTPFQVPPLEKRKRIPMRTIRALAGFIARNFQPEQVILFGSHAYGKPTGTSDVDLLIIMDVKNNELDTALQISNALPKHSFRVDIIVRTRADLEKRKKLGDWFLIDITEKCKVLYERTDQRMG